MNWSAPAQPGMRNRCRSSSDPRQVSYGKLLPGVLFGGHNPPLTQGPDKRHSISLRDIYPNEEQTHVAAAYVAQLQAAGIFQGYRD